MVYVAKTRVALPVIEEREVWPGINAPVATGGEVVKTEGERITKKELQDAGQNDEMIAALVKSGAIEEE